ncbi:MAG: NAD-dependent epimerase/dehydratase family protein, partial [Bacteroidaceae bacterium]|nr:NAD-dependent epimerase/dehydratase family protein [Bacteroidaceae bacterium]
ETYSGYVNTMSARSCYPSSKRAAETLCVAYAEEYGVDAVVARLSHVYGPRFTESDNRVYAQFIRNVLQGQDIVMKSAGEQFRSWCYVVDAVKGLLYILLKGASGCAYNVADSSSNISIRQLAEMVADIGGSKVVVNAPADDERKGYNPVIQSVYSTNKLEELGWKVMGTMREKMEATIGECKTR